VVQQKREGKKGGGVTAGFGGESDGFLVPLCRHRRRFEGLLLCFRVKVEKIRHDMRSDLVKMVSGKKL